MWSPGLQLLCTCTSLQHTTDAWRTNRHVHTRGSQVAHVGAGCTAPPNVQLQAHNKAPGAWPQCCSGSASLDATRSRTASLLAAQHASGQANTAPGATNGTSTAPSQRPNPASNRGLQGQQRTAPSLRCGQAVNKLTTTRVPLTACSAVPLSAGKQGCVRSGARCPKGPPGHRSRPRHPAAVPCCCSRARLCRRGAARQAMSSACCWVRAQLLWPNKDGCCQARVALATCTAQ